MLTKPKPNATFACFSHEFETYADQSVRLGAQV